jgi:hypothetical protein
MFFRLHVLRLLPDQMSSIYKSFAGDEVRGAGARGRWRPDGGGRRV